MKTKKLLTQCSILSMLAFCAAPPAVIAMNEDTSGAPNHRASSPNTSVTNTHNSQTADLIVYDNSSETGEGLLSKNKTFAMLENVHPTHAGFSNLYRNMGVINPKVPLVHPHEDWTFSNSSRIDDGILRTPLVMHIPNECLWQLPAPITERIRANGVVDVSIFLAAQNMPWNPDVPLLFRPHYGMFPDAPTVGTENIYLPTTVGLFYSDNGNLSLGEAPINTFIDLEVILNPANHAARTPALEPDTLVLSGDRLHIRNLSCDTPQSVWSYVEYLNGNVRTALVTLHWFLDDAQTDAIYDIFQYKNTGNMSGDEFERIEHTSAFQERAGGLEKLKDLTREEDEEAVSTEDPGSTSTSTPSASRSSITSEEAVSTEDRGSTSTSTPSTSKPSITSEEAVSTEDRGSTSTSIPSTSSPSILSLVRTLDKDIENLITLQGPETAQWVNAATFTVNVPRSYTYNSAVQKIVKDTTILLGEIRTYLNELLLYNKVSGTYGKQLNATILDKYLDALYRQSRLSGDEVDISIADSLRTLAVRLESIKEACSYYDQKTNLKTSEALGKTLIRFVQLLEQAPPAKEGIVDLVKQLDLMTQACTLKYRSESKIVIPVLDKLLSYINSNLTKDNSAAVSARKVIDQIKDVLQKDDSAFTKFTK